MGCGTSHTVTPAIQTLQMPGKDQPNKLAGGPKKEPSSPFSEVPNFQITRPVSDGVANRANSMKSPVLAREKLPALPVRALSSWNYQHRRAESGSNTNRDSKTSREPSLLEFKTGAITGSKTRIVNSDFSTTKKSDQVSNLIGNTKPIKKATPDLHLSHGNPERGYLTSTPDLGELASVQTVGRETLMIQQIKDPLTQPTSIKVVGMANPNAHSGPLDTGLSILSNRAAVSHGSHACNCQFCPQKNLEKNLGIEEEKEEEGHSHKSVLANSFKAPEWGPGLDKSGQGAILREEDHDDSGIQGLLKASLDGMDSIGEMSRKKGATSFATSKEDHKNHKANMNTSKLGDMCVSIREEGFDMLDRSNLENSMFFQDPDEYSQFFGRLKSKFSNRKKLGLNILEGLMTNNEEDIMNQASKTPQVFSKITQFRRKRRPSESMRDIPKNFTGAKDQENLIKKPKKQLPKQASLNRSNLNQQGVIRKWSASASLQNSLTLKGSEIGEENPICKDKNSKKPSKDRFSKNLPCIQENAEVIESATNSPTPRPGLPETSQKVEMSGLVLKQTSEVDSLNDKAKVLDHPDDLRNTEFSVAAQQKIIMKDVKALPPSDDQRGDMIAQSALKQGKKTTDPHVNKKQYSNQNTDRRVSESSVWQPAHAQNVSTGELAVHEMAANDNLPVQTDIDESARFADEVAGHLHTDEQFQHLKRFSQTDFPLTLSVGVRSQFKIKLHNPGSFMASGGGANSQNNQKGSASPASLNYTLTFQPDDPGNMTKRSAGNKSYWTFEAAQKPNESADFRPPDDSLISPPQLRSHPFTGMMLEGLQSKIIPTVESSKYVIVKPSMNNKLQDKESS